MADAKADTAAGRDGTRASELRATYRLQLHERFTLHDAAALAPYLHELGVSHYYLSPILRAAPGSMHGYDGIDPTEIDPERGGEPGLNALHEAAQRAGLGVVLDIVPNHLDVSTIENPYWRSVLELGRQSPHADVFDIDWGTADAEEGRAPDDPEAGVLVPVLGVPADEAVRDAAMRVQRTGGRPEVRYYDHRLPLSPASCVDVLERVAPRVEGEARRAVDGLLGEYRALADPDEIDTTETKRAADRLAGVCGAHPDLAGALDEELSRLSRDAEALGRLLERQHYRLTYWRRATWLLNYRRFFNINTLAGVRVEDPAVFELMHRRVLELVRGGVADGLRVDHPDGLRDPAGYFRRLREQAPGAWVLAEKILEHDERLRGDWPIDGTTGYDFLNLTLGVLVNPDAEASFDETYASFLERGGERAAPLDEVLFEAKLRAARELMAADLIRLGSVLARIEKAHCPEAGGERAGREAISLVAACMPVYRTYIVPERRVIADEDRRLIAEATACAERRRPDLTPVIGLVREVLLLNLRSPGTGGATDEDEFVARFQQYSAPVMAKGVEDTAFYRTHRCIALNEVGGSPARFGVSRAQAMAEFERRAVEAPRAMLCTSTHDTKRSEDVRARLAALTEVPGLWREAVERFARHAAAYRPDRLDANTEYLFWQTLVGAWPIGVERMQRFLEKAARESGVHTSWTEQDAEYEGALRDFAAGVLGDDGLCARVDLFVRSVLGLSRGKALVQTLLKLTAPGVPDIYQGCELWDLSLVDPDNRRPVDYELRRRVLAHARGAAPHDLSESLAEPDDPGLSKVRLTIDALRARRRHADAFGVGSGLAELDVERHGGPIEQPDPRLMAYARTGERGEPRVLVLCATRGMAAGAERFKVSLPVATANQEWRNMLTGATHAGGVQNAGDVLGGLPVALLIVPERVERG